jgi:hypothetical protein
MCRGSMDLNDNKDLSISQKDGSFPGGGMSAFTNELAEQYYSESGCVIDIGGLYIICLTKKGPGGRTEDKKKIEACRAS